MPETASKETLSPAGEGVTARKAEMEWLRLTTCENSSEVCTVSEESLRSLKKDYFETLVPSVPSRIGPGRAETDFVATKPSDPWNLLPMDFGRPLKST